jgi:hypothetical protein
VTAATESTSQQTTSQREVATASHRRPSIVAGAGALAFAILTIVGLALINPPGGTYSVSNVGDYLSKGHRASAFAGLYVEIIAVVGLLLALAFLRNAIGSRSTRRIFWTLGMFGAVSLILGWTIADAGVFARVNGGSAIVVSAPTSYLVSQIGLTLAWGPGAIFLGLALVTLTGSSSPALPAWLRWTTLALGVVALASPAFFPSLALPVWAAVTGIWLLAAGSRIQDSDATPA